MAPAFEVQTLSQTNERRGRHVKKKVEEKKKSMTARGALLLHCPSQAAGAITKQRVRVTYTARRFPRGACRLALFFPPSSHYSKARLCKEAKQKKYPHKIFTG